MSDLRIRRMLADIKDSRKMTDTQNALRCCMQGRPLGMGHGVKWRNAAFLVAKCRPRPGKRSDRFWLEVMADVEGSLEYRCFPGDASLKIKPIARK